MNKVLSGFAAALCVCAAEGRVWAQATQPEPHVVLTYMKTTPRWWSGACTASSPWWSGRRRARVPAAPRG